MSPESTPVRILLLDDDESFREQVATYFRGRGHLVAALSYGRAARDDVPSLSADVVLADLNTASAAGLDVIQRLRGSDPFLPVIAYAETGDGSTVAQAFERGASDFLAKPISMAALEGTVRRSLDRARSQREEVEDRRRGPDEALHLAAELEREQQRLRALSTGIAEALIKAMEAKSVYLRGHSERVASLAASLAAEMEMDDESVEDVRLAGRLHDIGKIGIREDVLDKPGSLTPEEYAHVRQHVRIGMDILQPLNYLGRVIDYVRDHQERPDGGGYPRGLVEKEIPLGARIVGAADAFDAITSPRSFREAMSVTEAIQYLRGAQGRVIAPSVFEALDRVVSQGRTLVFLHEAPQS